MAAIYPNCANKSVGTIDMLRWWSAVTAPFILEEIYTQEEKPISFLQGLRAGAITGIARPESFEAGLQKLGCEVIYSRQYADHHRYSDGQIKRMFERSKARGAKAIITTEKDAVRFPRMTFRPLPIYFLRMEIEILKGHDVFERCVKAISEFPNSAPE